MDIMLTTRYLDDLTTLGVTIPKATVAARAIYDEACRVAQRSPSHDLRAAYEAGEVTPENVAEMVYKTAADLTAQQNASTIVRDLQVTLNRAINAGLRDNLHRVRNDLDAAFKPAAAAVMAAAEHGIGPDTTADDVIGQGTDTISAFNEVSAHCQTLENVSRAYITLLREITGSQPDELVTLFIAEAGDLSHASEVYRGANRWLALAHAGFKLRLNDTDKAATVAAKALAAEAKAAAAQREIELAAHRRAHMPMSVGRGAL